MRLFLNTSVNVTRSVMTNKKFPFWLSNVLEITRYTLSERMCETKEFELTNSVNFKDKEQCRRNRCGTENNLNIGTEKNPWKL